MSGFFCYIWLILYVLYSSDHQKIYIRFTSNIEKRLESHNRLATKGWTIKFRPWELIYTENYELKGEAMKREKQLKSAKGREFIWNIIREKY